MSHIKNKLILNKWLVNCPKIWQNYIQWRDTNNISTTINEDLKRFNAEYYSDDDFQSFIPYVIFKNNHYCLLFYLTFAA